jgi:hypothetical protein
MCKLFEEVMGNCNYRTMMALDAGYCEYSKDDCVEKYCPAIGNPTRRQSSHSYYNNGEPGDSQCPTCGSVVMSSEITLPSEFAGYSFGFLWGVIGALACVILLFIGGAIKLG